MLAHCGANGGERRFGAADPLPPKISPIYRGSLFPQFPPRLQGMALIIKRFHTDLKGVPHGLRHGFGMLRQDRVKTGICRRVVLSFKRFQRPRAAHLFWAVVDQDHLQHHKASEQERAKDK